MLASYPGERTLVDACCLEQGQIDEESLVNNDDDRQNCLGDDSSEESEADEERNSQRSSSHAETSSLNEKISLLQETKFLFLLPIRSNPEGQGTPYEVLRSTLSLAPNLRELSSLCSRLSFPHSIINLASSFAANLNAAFDFIIACPPKDYQQWPSLGLALFTFREFGQFCRISKLLRSLSIFASVPQLDQLAVWTLKIKSDFQVDESKAEFDSILEELTISLEVDYKSRQLWGLKLKEIYTKCLIATAKLNTFPDLETLADDFLGGEEVWSVCHLKSYFHLEQWILEKHDLLRERGEDLKILSEEEYQKIMIFFVNFIQAIGQDANLKIRMQAIATACVYFRRFYARRSFRDVDPFLLAPTCILLASKVEESGMVSLTKLFSSVQSALKKWPYLNQELVIRQALLQEAEFCMLEIMDCCLIVYHPYRPLNQIIQDMKTCGGVPNTDQLYQDAWRVCNDSLRSDVALLYAPHQIAIASLIVASILNGRDKEKELKNWLSELAVDYEKIFEIEQMIFNMYRVWKSFEEHEQLLGLLAKLPRPLAQIHQKRE